MATGTVNFFDAEKGFGFITPDDGEEDLYAHFSKTKSSGFMSLEEGDRVSFDVKTGPNGQVAANITQMD